MRPNVIRTVKTSSKVLTNPNFLLNSLSPLEPVGVEIVRVVGLSVDNNVLCHSDSLRQFTPEMYLSEWWKCDPAKSLIDSLDETHFNTD